MAAMTMPSELLTRAADLIRDTAAPTTPGPWEAHYDGGLYSVAGPDGEAVCTDAENNRVWIALMSPVVAPHLEAWLRSAAREVEGVTAATADVWPSMSDRKCVGVRAGDLGVGGGYLWLTFSGNEPNS